MSSSRERAEEAAEAASEAVTDALSVSPDPERSRRTASFFIAVKEFYGVDIVRVGLALAAVLAFLFLAGVPITFREVVVLTVIGFGVSLVTNRFGGLSFSFSVLIVAIVAALVELFFPGAILSLFDPAINWLTMVPALGPIVDWFAGLSPFEKVASAVLLVVVIDVIWIRGGSALVRRSGQPIAANADTVARALARRWERRWSMLVGIGVALAGLLLEITGIGLSGIGEIIGQVGGYLAQAPGFAAAAFQGLLAYLATGGEVPVVGDWPVVGELLDTFAGFNPATMAVFVLGVLAVAYAVRQRRD